jgi:hypothetical protein
MTGRHLCVWIRLRSIPSNKHVLAKDEQDLA